MDRLRVAETRNKAKGMIMKEMVINKGDMAGLLTELAGEMTVIAPAKKGDNLLFEPISDGSKAVLDSANTRLSPKGVLFPQCEQMMTFTTDRKQARLVAAENAGIMQDVKPLDQGQVIWGIRPCDTAGFLILDKVFNQGGAEYEDAYYLRRREKTAIVGLGCNKPLSTCFCTSFDNGGPFATNGLDVLLTEVGDKYVVTVLTDKGEALLKGKNGLSEADSASIDQAGQIKDAALKLVYSSIKADKIKGKTTMELFDDPCWDTLYETCMACGVCTYSCPTCHCFDIQDEMIDTEGVRMRNWDSCMFSLFTAHATGHNPRPTKKERFKQRFMHKFKYFQEKFDRIACVGCGRCIQLCPVNIDVRQVVKEMNR
ncbi:MAG: 4Fe-4S dicluster domain-containing protein [bacterium]|nr:4Fe-4S dicluster domain-containing protein [bacterium]